MREESAQSWLRDFDEVDFHRWMDEVVAEIPEKIKAVSFEFCDDAYIFCFGEADYDVINQEWSEDADFESESPYPGEIWLECTEEMEARLVEAVAAYMKKGEYAEKLKKFCAVGVGILGSNPKTVYRK